MMVLHMLNWRLGADQLAIDVLNVLTIVLRYSICTYRGMKARVVA